MLTDALFLLTVLAVLGAGLIAGVFFAFSAIVMPALARLPPARGIAAMQAINVVVLNPWFLGAFFGTAVACLPLALSSVLNWTEPGAGFRLAGSMLYLVGTIMVTIAFNVPRNDALAAVAANSASGADVWARYVPGWTAWNSVRTVAALTAAALLTASLFVR
ncbi:MAG: DUF1772 domain-containing protein [Chloroflexia bacterium]|nr:DUF1772 domain-containing protein [Chloroflexia bacterium]MDQ3411564.1 DUF1772 domain-containing protein [Chloroflexota bacterium]